MKRINAWAAATLAAVLGLAAFRELAPFSDDLARVVFFEQSAILALLAWAAASDLRARVIPNGVPFGVISLHLGAVAAFAALGGAAPGWLLGRSLLGALAIGGGVLAVALAYESIRRRPALGGGDVKLLFALGFAFGWERAALLLMVACLAFVLAVALREAAACLARPAAAPAAGAPAARNAPAAAETPATRDIPAAEALATRNVPAAEAARPFAPALAIGAYAVMLCF